MSPFFIIMIMSAPVFCFGGVIGLLYPYKKINTWIGYRVKLARKSQKHWDFAQIIFAQNMFLVGIAYLLLGVLEGIFQFFPPWGLLAEVTVAILLPILGVIRTHLRLMKFDRENSN